MGRKRRKALPAMSAKKQLRIAARQVVVELVSRRDHHRCQARHLVTNVSCGGHLDPHEIIPRSAWQLGYLEVDNVVMVCRRHHEWIDNHPDEAFALGLHGYSWQRATAGPCSKAQPCERYNPLHFAIYGECWIRMHYSSDAPRHVT